MAAATASGLQLARAAVCSSQSTSVPITARSGVCNLAPMISFASSRGARIQSFSFPHSIIQLSRAIKTEAVKRIRGPTEIRAVANDNGVPSVLSIDLREPLFHDPYAGCFVELELYKGISLNIQNVSTSYLNNYCLATRFIDDKLLGNVNIHSSIRQMAWILGLSG